MTPDRHDSKQSIDRVDAVENARVPDEKDAINHAADNGQAATGYETLGLWETVLTFKVATAVCFFAAFSALTDGYQIGFVFFRYTVFLRQMKSITDRIPQNELRHRRKPGFCPPICYRDRRRGTACPCFTYPRWLELDPVSWSDRWHDCSFFRLQPMGQKGSHVYLLAHHRL